MSMTANCMRPTSWLKDVIYDAVLVNAMTSQKESLPRHFLKKLYGPFVNGRFVKLGESFTVEKNTHVHVALSKNTALYGDNDALLTTSKSFTIRASEKKKFYVKWNVTSHFLLVSYWFQKF